MKVVCINRDDHTGFVLLNQFTDLPCVGASIWVSLYENKFSDSYIRKKLHAVSKLYDHVSENLADPMGLDKLLLKHDIDGLDEQIRSFLGALQNQSKQKQINTSRTLKHSVGFVIDTVTELAVRSHKPKEKIQSITRSLNNLRTLYKFLRPEKKNVNLTIRSIPSKVTDEVFDIVAPSSSINPFRTEKLKKRNFLIIALLFYMGLRRGELLTLDTSAFKSEYSASDGHQLYWLNIRATSQIDTRVHTPSLKNDYSERQIPLPEAIYFGCLDYVTNWRGRCPHGFLVPTITGAPLSERGLNEMFIRLNQNMSNDAKAELKYVTGSSTFSPHSLRHSAAVYRIRAFREAGFEMSQAEALMRSFFGWSYTSSMPRRYAKAYYQEQLSTTWFEQMNRYMDAFYMDAFK